MTGIFLGIISNYYGSESLYVTFKAMRIYADCNRSSIPILSVLIGDMAHAEIVSMLERARVERTGAW